MNVFLVLFLVLSNTIGNEGDSNHGLINFNVTEADFPLYIVSLRTIANDHLCTGTIVSNRWVFSAFACYEAELVLYGLRKYEKNNLWGAHIQNFLHKIRPPDFLFSLFMVETDLGIKVDLPTNFNFRPSDTGTVIGWALENNSGALEMNIIPHVNIKDAFSNNTEAFWKEFCEIGLGSPLIFNDCIYGHFGNSREPFRNISYGLGSIKRLFRYNP